MVSWRYARASDIDRYYGKRPKETINAAVIVLNGEPVGIVGVSREGDTGLFFSEYKPEMAPHLGRLPVARAVMAVMKIVENYPAPVVADGGTDKGRETLEKLGFTRVEGDTYAWM